MLFAPDDSPSPGFPGGRCASQSQLETAGSTDTAAKSCHGKREQVSVKKPERHAAGLRSAVLPRLSV